MNTVTERKHTAYKRSNRAPKYPTSYDIPNEITAAAIRECESGEELETFDLDNFLEYVKSL